MAHVHEGAARQLPDGPKLSAAEAYWKPSVTPAVKPIDGFTELAPPSG
jgi:hypothetical protein